ncbi:LacI family DNA-binding transcriptional regulator [Alkaliphilus peptidifermentans]|uniref:Transcriptional regulator, LacI family n=1 Tax=Alkaliphilus peptidifermentans DSM 18978 TaxID=1120976 RepID=A0A1G5JN13_9FIRM|nr:LacI family DNA-binding transcriptional regulator [Alkaliphilus peptidifermentans]SCY89544.1 transcriptional regulator, LacI family [Alkaliphilus peptidifermentans DSM 18978]
MKFNIKDVAKKAGVSISTVSRVINESKVVRQETQEKVLKAIEELGYKPNAIARSLKIKNTKTIGIMIPDISNQFYPEVVRGVEDIANMYNYNIFLCNTDLDEEKEMKYFDVLAEKQVDGVILMGNIVSEELYTKIMFYNIPIILIGTDYENLPSVTIDNTKAAKSIVSYLIKKEHNRIGMITGKNYDPVVGVARLNGYKEALKENEMLFETELVVEGGYRFKSGYEGAKKLLSLSDRPTAIFVANDEMAIGAMRAALELNVKIPDELAIVGFDNIDMSEKFYPALTTVAQPMYEMGAIGMRVLTKILNEEAIETHKIVLNYSLLERESS